MEYFAPIFGKSSILFHASLVGGFVASRINKVLNLTGYLKSGGNQSMTRLYETAQFITDCMKPDGMKPGQIGFQSTIQVRFLHAKIRRRILKIVEAKGNDEASFPYSVKKEGIPINQEDMIVTLLSFSMEILLVLECIGYQIDKQDQQDCLMLWRLIGHYMGIEDDLNPCKDLETARLWFESLLAHLMDPDDSSSITSRKLLDAKVNIFPSFQSKEQSYLNSVIYLGKEWEEKVLAKGSPSHKIKGWKRYWTLTSIYIGFFQDWTLIHCSAWIQKCIGILIDINSFKRFKLKMLGAFMDIFQMKLLGERSNFIVKYLPGKGKVTLFPVVKKDLIQYQLIFNRLLDQQLYTQQLPTSVTIVETAAFFLCTPLVQSYLIFGIASIASTWHFPKIIFALMTLSTIKNTFISSFYSPKPNVKKME